MRSHDVEYSLQICNMITFVADLHCNIIYIALYALAYMLVEDRIRGTLVCCICVLQSKRYYCVAFTPSGVLKDVCFSSSEYILI